VGKRRGRRGREGERRGRGGKGGDGPLSQIPGSAPVRGRLKFFHLKK